MESLHAATLYLLRFGGMHPFKTKQNLNQIKISECLVLWTVFLQLINALSVMYIFLYRTNITSLHTFLSWVGCISFVIITILLPMHFMCHAKEIAAANRRINNILGMFSINSLKISNKSKLTIFLLVIVKIIYISLIVYVFHFLDCLGFNSTIVSKIANRFVDYHAILLDAISSFIFVIYLTILEEYFGYYDVCLGELFDGRRYFIGKISVITMRDYNYKFNNAAIYPIDVDKSINAQEEVNRSKTRNSLPNLCPTNQPKLSKQFTKSLRIRVPKRSKALTFSHVGTQICVDDAYMQDFFQNFEKINASILEVYEIYELYKCIFGFPLLYLMIVTTIDCCSSSYLALVGLRDNCNPVIFMLIPLVQVINFILLTMVPHTLDDKVSNVITAEV